MSRINEKLVRELINGAMSPLLKVVKSDDTLCLEIRKNCINIYYRGGSLLNVSMQDGNCTLQFNNKYCIDNDGLWDTFDTTPLQTINDYIRHIPYLKREMNNWFSKYPKLEREFQQQILRENNLTSNANDTDYFISDIEYANSENGSRFDMTGIKWLSTATDRKKLSPSLAIIEVKYGDSSMTGSSGIVKHFTDIKNFIHTGKMNDLYEEVESQFNQKVELGLIKGISTKIKIDRTKKAEFILLCANHKPASSILVRELKSAIETCPNITDKIDVKIAKSSLMGYGLYDAEMIDIKVFLSESREAK